METVVSAPPMAPLADKKRVVLKNILFFAGLVLCLTPWAAPPLALALGIALALTSGNPYPEAAKSGANWLLKACVVLLGFGMNLSVVLQAGRTGLGLAAASIIGTFALGLWAGRRLGIGGKTSFLISAGTAICGGSAIATVGAATGAAGAEMTVALGTVFVLNAVALYVFPVIGHALHLSQTQFGTWAGIGIHDISSVVGAASHYGLTALQTATAVKLSRALWIVPVAAVAARLFPAPGRGKPAIPWFIGAFLVASLARTCVPGLAAYAPLLSQIATVGLTLTLFLIGTSLSRSTLAAVGLRPLTYGVLLWLAVSAGSLWAVLHLA